jgi:tetraacyldisaccharide 4'-kinase
MYGTAAAWRRHSWSTHPARSRRLARPVISVGNLRVGGSGKTPIVAHVARLLVARGERPAILSRGYARTRPADGVTVVSDGRRVLADVASAGDEPLMLARMLPDVPVLVCDSRYLAGRLAERQFDVTVHLLDDGFQHFELARDADLLVVAEEDLDDQPLPAGRLREPLSVASAADALIVPTSYDAAAERVARTLGVPTSFRVARAIAAPRTTPRGDSVVVPSGSRVFGVAGIARPDRFFGELSAAGWEVVGTMAFRDHHQYTATDVARIGDAARSAAASIVLTTEKDAVRLAPLDLAGVPVAAVPLTVAIEPAAAFTEWLLARLSAARSGLEARS